MAFSSYLLPSVLFPQPRDMIVRLNKSTYGKHIVEQCLAHNMCYMNVCKTGFFFKSYVLDLLSKLTKWQHCKPLSFQDDP